MNDITRLRELFIKRMTVDSRNNQAIFGIESDADVDAWNAECEEFGLRKKSYGRTYQVWSDMDMDMVLKCFDDAVNDLKGETK